MDIGTAWLALVMLSTPSGESRVARIVLVAARDIGYGSRMSAATATESSFNAGPLPPADVWLTVDVGLLGTPTGHGRVVGRVRVSRDGASAVALDATQLGEVRPLASDDRVPGLTCALLSGIETRVLHVGDRADVLARAFAAFLGDDASDAHAVLISIDRARDVAIFAFDAVARIADSGDIPLHGEIRVDHALRRIEGRAEGRGDRAQLAVSLRAVR
jgi:hypothetical protein